MREPSVALVASVDKCSPSSPKTPWLFDVSCPAESNPPSVALPVFVDFSAPLAVLDAASPGEGWDGFIGEP
jgi:hypothetical protein